MSAVPFSSLTWSPTPHVIDEAKNGIDDVGHPSVDIVFFTKDLVLLFSNVVVEVISLNQCLDLVLKLVSFFSVMAMVTVKTTIVPLTSLI